MKKHITLVIYLSVLLHASSLMAEPPEPRGKVLQFSGVVEVIDAQGEKRRVLNADEKISEMDTIVTEEDARIVMLFDDGSLSILSEKSRLRIEKTNWFAYLGGKIYFTYRKVFGEPRRVRTRTATIGVRGTTFFITEDGDDSEAVALKEGLLELVTTGPAFEIHKQDVLDEFEQFRQRQKQAVSDLRNEFEDYKKQTMQEFVEYRSQFLLKPGRTISLSSGYRVDERGLSETDKTSLEAFEADAADIIKAFRGMPTGH